jgi:uncharacterized protein (TIRG00374 family)
MRSATVLLLAKVGLSAALLLLVLQKVDATLVLAVLGRADRWGVLLWYALVPVTIGLSAWRWSVLAPGITYGTALKYSWIGLFFGHVLPGSISGDIAKGVSLALKDTTARTGLAASIVTDKVIGLAALLLFFDVACAVVFMMYGEVTPQVRQMALIALVLSTAFIAAGIVGAIAAIRSEQWSRRLGNGSIATLARRAAEALQFYRDKPSSLAKAFGISALIHIVNIFGTYLSFRALHVGGDLLLAAVVYPVTSVMLLIPISISGIGVRDATLAVLFALFGLPAASGVAISWLALLATIPNIVIGGLVQLFEMYRKQ